VTQPLVILLVEDNPADVLLTREALADSAICLDLRVAVDGRGALEELRRNSDDDRLPDLVLLDVQLPGMSGHDVLRTIKADNDLGALPVVMLSSSRADDDVRRSYEAHASCYVAKPAGLDDYLDVVHSIEDFWLATVRLPTRTAVR
jgi:CheY-like chemotaxis protein